LSLNKINFGAKLYQNLDADGQPLTNIGLKTVFRQYDHINVVAEIADLEQLP